MDKDTIITWTILIASIILGIYACNPKPLEEREDYQAGYSDGHSDGFDEGREQGHEEGLEEGRQEICDEVESQLNSGAAYEVGC